MRNPGFFGGEKQAVSAFPAYGLWVAPAQVHPYWEVNGQDTAETLRP